MADLSPAEELRAAIARLRGNEHHGWLTCDTTNPEITRFIINLLNSRGPLAELLDHLADDMDDHGAYERYAGAGLTGPDRQRVVVDEDRQMHHDWTAALAVARTILGATR